MQNQRFYNLFKDSRFAQVATPLSKQLRGNNRGHPTHQILFAPKGSAKRAEYGLKTPLPEQVGLSHIVMNKMDTANNIPDVEKFSSTHYNRLKFQESGIALKHNEPNPLFNWKSSSGRPGSKTATNSGSYGAYPDSITTWFNLGYEPPKEDVMRIIKENPSLASDFKKWLVKRSPETAVFRHPARMTELLEEFIASSKTIKKRTPKLKDLTRKFGEASPNATGSPIRGTAGLSYNQKGRLSNTPNGIKNRVILPGRLVEEREVTMAGFVAGVNERTTMFQNNMIRNAPGKHRRQFVLPFTVHEADLTPSGGLRMSVDGVRVGSWVERVESGPTYTNRPNYVASNPKYGSLAERSSKEDMALQNLLGLVSKNKA